MLLNSIRRQNRKPLINQLQALQLQSSVSCFRKQSLRFLSLGFVVIFYNFINSTLRFFALLSVAVFGFKGTDSPFPLV